MRSSEIAPTIANEDYDGPEFRSGHLVQRIVEATGLRGLHALVRPTVIAVVGASEKPGPGRNVFLNLVRSDTATIFAVNPRSETILGYRAYPHLRDLPVRPDLVVVSVAAKIAVDVVAEAGALGIPAAVVLSSGFAELGDEGLALQEKLAAVARESGMAICGPNCMGFLNFTANIPAFSGLAPNGHANGNVACFAQSGSVTVSLVTALGNRLAMAVSAGNQAVSDATDFLHLFSEEPAVRVSGFFLESVPRAREFLAAAKSAGLAGKPVVICRTGRSEKGAKATSAHTGALAQPYESFVQIARRHGTVMTDELDGFSCTLKLFSSADNHPPRPGVALVSMSGGLNALALDLADEVGLTFAPLSSATLSRLEEALPSYGSPANPLDVTGTVMADENRYKECLTAVAEDPAVGQLVVLIPLTNPDIEESERYRFHYMVEAAARVGRESGKQVVLLAATSGPLEPELARLCEESGLILLAGFRAGLAAVANVDNWNRWYCAETERTPLRSIGEGRPVASLTRQAVRPDDDPQQALRDAGLPFPKEKVAKTLDEALEAADRIGYPVVLKIASADILHKTDVGGVRLGVSDSTQLKSDWFSLLEEVGQKAPHANIDGVLVAEQVPDGLDLIVGSKWDEGLGPLVLVGMGGIYAELFADTVIAQAPLTRAEALELLDGLKGRQLLNGARGRPRCDVEAMAELIATFSRFVGEAGSSYSEIDLNPVRVLEAGQGVRVLDSLFVANPACSQNAQSNTVQGRE